MKKTTITVSTSVKDADAFDLEAHLDWDGPAEPMRYEVHSQETIAPPVSADWAVLSVLFPLMKAKRDVFVDAPISAKLLHYVNTDIQAALTTFDPSLGRIEISAAETIEHPPERTNRRGTGFSGGVDSFATLFTYDVGTLQPLTDLTYFNVGTFGDEQSPDSKQVFADGYERAKRKADQRGLNIISVQGAVGHLYRPDYNFLKSHTVRNAAAALTLESHLDEYLYSSAFEYRFSQVKPHYELTPLDPILLPLMSNGAITFYSGCAGMSRFDKTALITEHPETFGELDVCILLAHNRTKLEKYNCSGCAKCFRTMLTLDALGKLDNYSDVFNLRYFRRKKAEAVRVISKLARSYHPIEIDLVERLAQAGTHIPGRAESWYHDFNDQVRKFRKRVFGKA